MSWSDIPDSAQHGHNFRYHGLAISSRRTLLFSPFIECLVVRLSSLLPLRLLVLLILLILGLQLLRLDLRDADTFVPQLLGAVEALHNGGRTLRIALLHGMQSTVQFIDVVTTGDLR